MQRMPVAVAVHQRQHGVFLWLLLRVGSVLLLAADQRLVALDACGLGRLEGRASQAPWPRGCDAL